MFAYIETKIGCLNMLLPMVIMSSIYSKLLDATNRKMTVIYAVLSIGHNLILFYLENSNEV